MENYSFDKNNKKSFFWLGRYRRIRDSLSFELFFSFSSSAIWLIAFDCIHKFFVSFQMDVLIKKEKRKTFSSSTIVKWLINRVDDGDDSSTINPIDDSKNIWWTSLGDLHFEIEQLKKKNQVPQTEYQWQKIIRFINESWKKAISF